MANHDASYSLPTVVKSAYDELLFNEYRRLTKDYLAHIWWLRERE